MNSENKTTTASNEQSSKFLLLLCSLSHRLESKCIKWMAYEREFLSHKTHIAQMEFDGVPSGHFAFCNPRDGFYLFVCASRSIRSPSHLDRSTDIRDAITIMNSRDEFFFRCLVGNTKVIMTISRL